MSSSKIINFGKNERFFKKLLTNYEKCTSIFRSCGTFDQIPKAPYIPIKLIGSSPFIMKAGGSSYLHIYADKLHKKLGPIYIDHMDGHKIIFLSDADANIKVYQNEGQYPVHVVPESWKRYLEVTKQKRGLFFMDGEEWHDSRLILNKLLMRTSTTPDYLGKIVDCSQEFIDMWSKNPPGDKLEIYLYRWITESIGNICFANRLNFFSDKNTDSNEEDAISSKQLTTEFIEGVHDIFTESNNLLTMPIVLAQKLNVRSWRAFSKASTRCIEIANIFVDRGIESCTGSNVEEDKKTSLLYKLAVEEKMDKEIIARIIADLVLAAADTTAHTALFILYLLGRHPEQRELARKEVTEALKMEGGKINQNYIANLSYLKCIIKESLRLYPTAPFLTRLLNNDTSLLGYKVPAGTMVITSLYTMGRNKNNFTNPESFRPERWSRNNTESLCPFKKPEDITEHTNRAFVHFGLGARSCVGKRLTELNLLTLLSHILINYDWTVDKEIDVILRMVAVPSEKVVLNLKKL